MGEAQKKRRIGVGMKPRVEQAQSGVEQASAVGEVSTTEGQPESILQPVLEQMKQAETSPLATQETVQILDSEQGCTTADPNLEKALQESGEVVDAEFEEVAEPSAADLDAVAAELTAQQETAGQEGTPESTIKALADGMGFADEGTPEHATVQAMAKEILDLRKVVALEAAYGAASFSNAKAALAWALGPQPNGTLKVSVTIEEGWVSAVQDWAREADVSVERWLSDLVQSNIEAYAVPAKGR